MNKKIALTLAVSLVSAMPSKIVAQDFASKQEWYDAFMEAEYEKDTMYYIMDTINKKYNKNVVYMTPVQFEVSYYTDLNSENGFGPVNCLGEKLQDGMVANNVLELGTQIYIPELGLKTVADRGSAKYFSEMEAIDVFVPRQSGESDAQYKKRVNNLGRHIIKGYILKEK